MLSIIGYPNETIMSSDVKKNFNLGEKVPLRHFNDKNKVKKTSLLV